MAMIDEKNCQNSELSLRRLFTRRLPVGGFALPRFVFVDRP
jgi:hypothetical protein